MGKLFKSLANSKEKKCAALRTAEPLATFGGFAHGTPSLGRHLQLISPCASVIFSTTLKI